MTIGKFKVTDICFIVLLVIFISCICFYCYNWYTSERDYKNDIITNFSEELIKGNKSKEDIDNLDVDEDIKKIFLEYFDKNYYGENTTYVVCEDVDYLDSIEAKAKEVALQCYVDGVFMSDLYRNALIDQDLVNYTIESTGESDNIEVESSSKFDKRTYFYHYKPNSKSNIKYKIENNKIVVNIDELLFNDGYCIINYKGFEFEIVRDVLDKKILSEMKKSEKYQSIKLKISTKVKNVRRDYFVDYLGNEYLITYEYSFGKIKKVIF